MAIVNNFQLLNVFSVRAAHHTGVNKFLHICRRRDPEVSELPALEPSPFHPSFFSSVRPAVNSEMFFTRNCFRYSLGKPAKKNRVFFA